MVRFDKTQTKFVYLHRGKARHNLEITNFLYKATVEILDEGSHITNLQSNDPTSIAVEEDDIRIF